MKIGIIGAGAIGGNLTRRLSALGHDVSVANSRGPETLWELVDESGATAVVAEDAATDAELIVVTIPMRAIPELPAGILTRRAPGAVVIDTNNYYPKQRDGRIAAIEDGTTESRWVSNQLGVPVVKVFNGIYASHLLTHGRPVGDPRRIALPIAGDHAPDKAVVTAILDEMGFDAVDAGGLDESWRQQPGTPVYGADADVPGVREALSAASPKRPADFTA